MKGIRFFQTIQFKLILIYVLLILIAMQLIWVYFVRTTESSLKNNFSAFLNQQANLLAVYAEPYLSSYQEGKEKEGAKTYQDLNDLVDNLFSISNAEIQFIDANGIVLSTSLPGHNTVIGQKNTQTEISRALQGIKQESIVSDKNGRKKVIAKPIGSRGKIVGVVYIVASMEDLYSTMNRINSIFISGTMIALALTALLGIILSHTLTSPIKEITKQATAVAEGNFDQKVAVLSRDEIGQLSHAFNYMTHRLQEALSMNEEEKEKLASILSNMSDGVMAADESGKVIVINRRAEHMLQTTDTEVYGKDMLAMLGLDSKKKDAYLSGKINAVMIQLDVPEENRMPDIRVSFTPIRPGGKGITGTIAVLQDVTEQEKLERSRKEFVANVSHELRTPLTTIRSYLEALDEGAVEDQKLSHQFVGVARNETERMIRLVTDLLHLSRLDSRQAPLHKELTHIPEMLDEVADRFAFQLRQKHIRIEVAAAEADNEINLDRDQIDQVLDNLVSNAIKYTPEGGRIRLASFKRDPHWIEIAVEDNGHGIPKKDIPYIFDRFYRVDKARSRSMGGTGLGLSIAREIIKAHGGQIHLHSEVNRGTKVVFTLPLQHGDEGEAMS